MKGLTIKVAQQYFFTADKVLKKLGKARAKVLSAHGNYVKKVAQRSMRPGGKKGKRSKPGEPPRTHGQKLLRKYLFAIYDTDAESVVVGPAYLAGSDRFNRGKTVPETLEYGGQSDSLEVLYKGNWVSRDYLPPEALRAIRFRQTRRVLKRIDKRPFMIPAEKTSRPKFMDRWRDAMSKV